MTRVLVLNAGSSSLKWTLFAGDGQVEKDGSEPWASNDDASHADQFESVMARLPAIDVAAHRLTHGGRRFREAVVIDDAVRKALGELVALDPEHMSASLCGIDVVRAARPAVRHVAAFDTAFHATLSEAAAGYGLPFEWTERFGLLRFGFHGLSVSYAVERMSALLGSTPARAIVCHLGAGCSLTAVEHGRSIDTSMGFSPLEGLMMGTRAGSVDPGVLFYLQEQCGISLADLRETLTKRSGLLGVSGISADLRQVIAAMDGGSARARVAYDRFVLTIQRSLGAMTAVLAGVDAVVFTGGMGENSASVRRDATKALAFAGLDLSATANESGPVDADVSAPGSRVRVLVIRSREDIAIHKATLRCLKEAPSRT